MSTNYQRYFFRGIYLMTGSDWKTDRTNYISQEIAEKICNQNMHTHMHEIQRIAIAFTPVYIKLKITFCKAIFAHSLLI